MALHDAMANPHRVGQQTNPMHTLDDPALAEELVVPTHRLGDRPIPAETAYQLVHDELMLDGNARLNLATFVTTWMEPAGRRLMAECADKNMIDKDEYPQTAEIEQRCVNMLADLWHAPDRRAGRRLLHHRVQRGVHARRAGAEVALARAPGGRRASRPTDPTS